MRLYPPHWEPWTASDDAKLAQLYKTEAPVDIIAAELERSIHAVVSWVHLLKINRPKESTIIKRKLVWEALNLHGLETLSS